MSNFIVQAKTPTQPRKTDKDEGSESTKNRPIAVSHNRAANKRVTGKDSQASKRQTQGASSEEEEEEDEYDQETFSESSSDETLMVEESFDGFGDFLKERRMQAKQKPPPTISVEPVESDIYEINQAIQTSQQEKAQTLTINKKTSSKIFKKQARRRPKLIVNVFNCRYDVVRDVARASFKMRVQEDESDDFDIFWSDGGILPERLSRLKAYQRMNHFPGMQALARKNNLGKHLKKMRKAFEAEYDFFPETWMLPSEMNDFRQQFQSNPTTNKGEIKKVKTYIVKPEASCQGKGIFLTRNLQDIDPQEHCVIQRYIAQPYLMDELKFDLRIYVLVFGVDPLRIFLYKDGLTRLATQPYEGVYNSNLEDICMHLTNYAVNKHSGNFIQNKTAEKDSVGHKRSLKYTMRYLQQVKREDTEMLWEGIKDIIIKTLISAQPSLQHVYRSCQPDDVENSLCFEILGFDILLDHKCRPILLEVNHSPSFSTDSPLDLKIKSDLIRDTIALLGLSNKRKHNYKQQHQEELEKRILTGKQQRPQGEQKEQLKSQFEQLRNQYELGHLGDYELIYPSPDAELMKTYQTHLDFADELWEQQTGSKSRKRALNDSNKPKPFIVSTSKHISGHPQTSQNSSKKQQSHLKKAPSSSKITASHKRQASYSQSQPTQKETLEKHIVQQISNQNPLSPQVSWKPQAQRVSSTDQDFSPKAADIVMLFTKSRKNFQLIKAQEALKTSEETSSVIRNIGSNQQQFRTIQDSAIVDARVSMMQKDYYPMMISNLQKPLFQNHISYYQQRNGQPLKQKSEAPTNNLPSLLEQKALIEATQQYPHLNQQDMMSKQKRVSSAVKRPPSSLGKQTKLIDVITDSKNNMVTINISLNSQFPTSKESPSMAYGRPPLSYQLDRKVLSREGQQDFSKTAYSKQEGSGFFKKRTSGSPKNSASDLLTVVQLQPTKLQNDPAKQNSAHYGKFLRPKLLDFQPNSGLRSVSYSKQSKPESRSQVGASLWHYDHCHASAIRK